MIGAYAVLNILAEHRGNYDAAVIAAFGDPGAEAGKEIAGVPVVGVTEAALSTACLVARRFSIVAISPGLARWYGEFVAYAGLQSRLASVRFLPKISGDVADVRNAQRAQLVSLCDEAAGSDGADAIIVAGAPLAGFAEELAHQVPIPMIDGTACAVRHAEMLVGLGYGKGRKGMFSPPTPKHSSGLPKALAHFWSGEQSG